MKSRKLLVESNVSVRIKLAALWTSLMFFYVYADLLGFYDARLLEEIMAGNMGFLGPITQSLKLSVAIMMSVPAIMISASLIMKAPIARWANVIIGVIYALIILVTLVMESWLYYKYFGTLEMLFTGYLIWTAWRWPLAKESSIE